jgi:hypothetical protein
MSPTDLFGHLFPGMFSRFLKERQLRTMEIKGVIAFLKLGLFSKYFKLPVLYPHRAGSEKGSLQSPKNTFVCREHRFCGSFVRKCSTKNVLAAPKGFPANSSG